METKDYIQKEYGELCDLLKNSSGNYDFVLIDHAYELAKAAHSGQTRTSGQPYVCHPIEVAKILAELGMDTESVVAALLHDVVEDTDIPLQEIRKDFGEDIANLVDGVTKLGKIPLSSKEETQAENIRKMLLAMSQDIRVIIIKLADRLHNMRTLSFLPEQKRRDKSLETIEVYAPIAHRLGIRAVKEELEDLALSFLDPIAYQDIEAALAWHESARNAFLQDIRAQIGARLETVVPHAHIEGRIKSIHGIYRKMYMQGRNFDEIYDVYAVRIIVDTVVDCYNVLGVIHDMYKPLPGRFKDYISTPKPNMYQSLHTTVIGKAGVPFEVQIRTWEMHQTAEYGIAAHWKYKLGMSGTEKFEERLAWIRQLLEMQKDSDDVEDIVRTIKTDLAPEEVFVFTPKGDVINLPKGATVIDFAYAIHSAVGNRMSGAKVDGRIVPIDYQVKTGEIVEVLTSSQQGKGPSRDWLNIVRTSEARSKIRSWFKKEKREENIIEGKAELERELKRNNVRLPEDAMREFIEHLAERQSCKGVEDFYAAIGYGGISVSRLMHYVKEEYNRIMKGKTVVDPGQFMVPERPSGNHSGVIVEGIDNCLIKLSRCCNPLPGDGIIGFITRGHGVSVHKRDCTNVPREIWAAAEPERWVQVHWIQKDQEEFRSGLQIVALDRRALLADVTSQLANMHVMLHSMNARELKDGRCVITLLVSINGIEHLKSIMTRLQKVEGVLSVERSGI